MKQFPWFCCLLFAVFVSVSLSEAQSLQSAPGIRVGASAQCRPFLVGRVVPRGDGKTPMIAVSLRERPKDMAVPCRIRVIALSPDIKQYTVSGITIQRLLRRESVTRRFNGFGRDGFAFRIAPKETVGDLPFELHFAVEREEVPGGGSKDKLLVGKTLSEITSCAMWSKVYNEEIERAARCNTVADCGRALPLGCGCTSAVPVRKDYNVPLFMEFLELAQPGKLNCDEAPFASICICGLVNRKEPIRCVNSRCQWNTNGTGDPSDKPLAVPVTSPTGEVEFRPAH